MGKMKGQDQSYFNPKTSKLKQLWKWKISKGQMVEQKCIEQGKAFNPRPRAIVT